MESVDALFDAAKIIPKLWGTIRNALEIRNCTEHHQAELQL